MHDKTIAVRLRRTSRRARRAGAAVLALGLLGSAGAAALPAAQAAEYGGFGTFATASPLKLEIYEPAIPIPSEPQLELDFSYTRVLGESGPAARARASAMWPGAAVGEGLKTFGEQLGLPAALTDGGYPVQSNAEYPGEVSQQSGEPLPGQVQRVQVSDHRAVAKAGYTGSGDLADGDAGDGAAPANPLEALQSGDLSALGDLLLGNKSGDSDNPLQTNPLGSLSLLIDFDGMTSVSSSDYDGETAVATATSRLGEVRLLAGLIKLTGINVVTKVTSSLDGGAKINRTIDVGGMTVAGQKFAFGPEGFEAAGKKNPIPGVPTDAAGLLEQLGVKIEVPKPEITKDGLSASIDAAAVRVTLDTKPLRSLLPELPLDQIVGALPDLPGQANILKGLLLSLNTFAPKLVLELGEAQASATTVEPIDFGDGGTPTDGGGDVVPPGGGTGTGGGDAIDAGGPIDAGSVPVDSPVDTGAAPDVTDGVIPTAAPGLPELGSVPMLLMIAGLALAGGAGWYLTKARSSLFGAGAACIHGLKTGIPDLRKV